MWEAFFFWKCELLVYCRTDPDRFHSQIQPQEISPPPTANLDRSSDKVYENVTGLVKAVIEMSSRIQPAPPEEYVPMVKVRSRACWDTLVTAVSVWRVFDGCLWCLLSGCWTGAQDFTSDGGRDHPGVTGQHSQRGQTCSHCYQGLVSFCKLIFLQNSIFPFC